MDKAKTASVVQLSQSHVTITTTVPLYSRRDGRVLSLYERLHGYAAEKLKWLTRLTAV